MFQFVKGRAVFAAFMGVVSSIASVSAADPAQELYEQAMTAFAGRENLAEVDRSLALLEQAAQVAVDADLKYDILILASRNLYWKGNHQKTDAEKMAVFEVAMEKATAAKELNDDYSEAYYFYGISLGKWGLAKGVMASLGRRKELQSNAEGAIERTTRDGRAGEELDGYGPNRTLGYMFYKLPSFAGGNRERALQLLEEAVVKAPTLVLNTVYLAEVLASGSANDKARARKLLDELLKKDPTKLDPNRVPEAKEELALARQLRKEIGG